MIFNMNGVNYDTMRTDEEITALVESGLTDGALRKELISEHVFNVPMSSTTAGAGVWIHPKNITLTEEVLYKYSEIYAEIDGSFEAYTTNTSATKLQIYLYKNSSTTNVWERTALTTTNQSFDIKGKIPLLKFKWHYPDSNYVLEMLTSTTSGSTVTVSYDTLIGLKMNYHNTYTFTAGTGTCKIYGVY